VFQLLLFVVGFGDVVRVGVVEMCVVVASAFCGCHRHHRPRR
jgi:hypothetical protein